VVLRKSACATNFLTLRLSAMLSQYGMLWLDASHSGTQFELGDSTLPPVV